MMNLNVTTTELLALIGQLTVENRILRQELAKARPLVEPKAAPPLTLTDDEKLEVMPSA